MKVFVTIPIHDREEHIQPCIDSLNRAGLDYELSIVANGCAFDPRPYLEQADDPHLVREALGPTEARNISLKNRKPGQDWLSLDSDIVFTTDRWLAKLRTTLYRLKDAGAVSPAIDNGDGPPFHDTRPGDGIKESPYLPVGARLVRGEVADRLGFLRQYGFYGCEDLDYDSRIRAIGFKLYYDADVAVTHPGIPSDDHWKRQCLEECLPKWKEWLELYGMGQMLYKPYPEMDFVPEMNPTWLAKNPTVEAYGTHKVGLRWAVENTTGPVLELGSGFHSTPYLNQVSKGMRQVVTVETDPRWKKLAEDRCQSPAHWVVDKIPPGLWSVVLIDSDTTLRAKSLAELRPYVEVFVLHDTEPEGFEAYGWGEEDFNAFKYRADYGDSPRTTLLSDTIDVSKFTGGKG